MEERIISVRLLFLLSRTSSGAHQNRCSWGGVRLGAFNPPIRRFSVFLHQQVRGDVPRLGPRLLPARLVGFRRAAAPLVLPSEAPQLGAPVFPPLEGQSGAVGHQAALLGGPAPLPLLRTDQEEGAAHVEGRAAAAEVAVGDPEGVGAPADTGGGPRAEDCLDGDGELPPGS